MIVGSPVTAVTLPARAAARAPTSFRRKANAVVSCAVAAWGVASARSSAGTTADVRRYVSAASMSK